MWTYIGWEERREKKGRGFYTRSLLRVRGEGGGIVPSEGGAAGQYKEEGNDWDGKEGRKWQWRVGGTVVTLR